MEPVYLYSFPFAAGSRYSYHPLVLAAPDWLKWIPLDYPGRGRRMFEPPKTVLTDIVSDLKTQILARPQTPFAFYGHSMGSLVAYLVTVELMREQQPLPRHLFLSGRSGACVPERQRHALQMSRDEIIAEVQRMDGDLSLLLRHPKQFDRYEHILRADMAALDSYEYAPISPDRLPVPATVFVGTADTCTPEQAQLWEQEFQEPVAVHVLAGGHFFIDSQAEAMIQIMTRDLRHSLLPMAIT